MFNDMFIRRLEHMIFGEPGGHARESDEHSINGPNKAAAFNSCGNVHASNGRIDRAIADYDHALQLNPKYIDAFLNRGLAFGMRGDLTRAIADFSQVIGLNLKNARAYYYRGSIYGMQGNYQRAVADLNEALRLDPKNKRALTARRLAERKLRDQLSRALGSR